MPATATKTKSGARKTASAAASRERGALKAVAPAPNGSGDASAPASRPTPRQGEGHGRRLTSAFEALEAFPALAESRNRLLAVVERAMIIAIADIVTAVESDVARLHRGAATRQSGPGRRGRVETIVAAVEVLSEQTVQALASRVRTFDFFERSSVWDAAPERFRLHALSTQHAADRLAAEVGYEHRDRLTVTSLLHDVGKLVLLHAYPGYPSQVHRGAGDPEERIHQERRELGVDHALVGGVLARRWGLPSNWVATAIERHHNLDVEGEVASFVRSRGHARRTTGQQVLAWSSRPGRCCRPPACSASAPISCGGCRYELPSTTGERQRHVDPSPLSGRELGVLQRLAEGKVCVGRSPTS